MLPQAPGGLECRILGHKNPHGRAALKPNNLNITVLFQKQEYQLPEVDLMMNEFKTVGEHFAGWAKILINRKSK